MSGPPGDFQGPPPPPEDEAATAAAPPPPPEETQPVCHRCGAPHDPFQEYCLECGARLARPAGSTWIWTRDSPFWFWAAFLGLLAIALVTGAIVLAATGDDPEAAPTTAPGTTLLTEPTTDVTTEPLPDTVKPPTLTGTTTTDVTFPTTTGLTPTFTNTATFPTTTTTPTFTTTTQPTTTTTTTTPGSAATWPAGRTAYTVIVGSYRESRGRAPAEARATQARNAGLSQVGVIRSSDFSSLRPGWYAVFTGIFDSRSDAMTRLTQARRTYPTAYLRYVRP